MAQHTIDLPCIADTYVDENNPNTNYGSATILVTSSHFPPQYKIKRTFLNFDNSNLPEHKKIINVQLKLYATESIYIGSNSMEIFVGLIRPNWDENITTFANVNFPITAWSRTDITNKSVSGNIYNIFTLTDANPYKLEKGLLLLEFNQPDGVELKFHSRENTNPPILRVVYEDVPPSQPTLLTPIGVYKDSSSEIRFEWQYNSDVGGEQKKFDLQWSVDQSDWTTISETTSNTYYDMPADTFPAGNIYWRVQTYNEYDESSGYSDAAVFYSVGAPTTPLIQSVSDECRPLVEWMAFDQQIYQLQILQGETIIYDTSDMPGISTRQYRIPIFLDDSEYLARIRIKNEYDMWSEWGTTSFTISTTKPDKPTLSIQRSQYGLELTIGGAQEVSYIYRDGVCIARATGEKYFDNTVANEKEYQYFIRALSEDGFADSDIEIGVPSFRYGLLNTGDEVIELKHNINAVPGKNLNNTQSGTLNMYDGRKYPVPEMSGNVEQTLVLGYFFKTYPDVERLIEIADQKDIVLYRDKRGRKMYGKITGLAVQDTFHGHNVSITISATDYDEAVEI